MVGILSPSPTPSRLTAVKIGADDRSAVPAQFDIATLHNARAQVHNVRCHLLSKTKDIHAVQRASGGSCREYVKVPMQPSPSAEQQ